MIIGHGDVAQALQSVDRSDLVFFASGVSNSQETLGSEYQREVMTLLQQSRDSHIVYFSSLSVFYDDTQYVHHKFMMEWLVKAYAKTYTIVRLGNILWGTNPHTLVNYLKKQIEEGLSYKIKDEYRFLITQDEFLYWMRHIPQWSCEMDCPGKRMKVADIVWAIKKGKL